MDNKQLLERACPQCQRSWPVPCEQTICIELFSECIVCRFGLDGKGTSDELEQIRKASAQSQESAQ